MIESQIFSGTPKEVQEALSAFLKDKNIKIQSFAQTQSAVNSNSDAPQVCITITLLYVELNKDVKHITGFNNR